MFKWLFSKKFKKENKIDRLISEYNLEFLINNLLKKGFTNPKYIQIIDGFLIYMEKQDMGMCFCEAFYCKNGKCESHKGLYNLQFLKEFIYKRERLREISINGKKINTSHTQLDEVHPNKTGDFIGLLNQYELKDEILDLINNKGFDPEFSFDRLQIIGNKYLISTSKLNDSNYICAYLCYGTDIVKFEGRFIVKDLINEIFDIFNSNIEVQELN